MYIKLIRWLKGYIKLNIEGTYKDRFINICTKNNVNMWGMNSCEKNITTYMLYNDYKNTRKYIDKTDVSIQIIEKIGLPFLCKAYKKRYGFMLGIALFFFLIYSFTSYIWDINVIGESIYTKEEIVKNVRDNYVDIGTPIEDINCEELEKILRVEYDKVAWISCELKGTQLNIEITETIEQDTIKVSNNPCNIIAAKDGVVTKIVTRNGKTIKTIGEEVKKGDVIITGVINIYNDYDELIETNYVPSDGDVYAIVENEYYDEFDLEYYDKVYTGNETKGYSIFFMNKSYETKKTNVEYELYDIITSERKIKLGSSVYLPVVLYEITMKEYEAVPCSYTKEEAEEKAYKRMALYIDELGKKGVSILENNVTIEFVNNKCIISGIIVTEELIGVPSELIIIEQGETQ
ncbi:MAG: sporulation protein YqfD [Lachnospiraceae bacterium]|nr:sporulation protein YqfD [Lachnospiraceae bacterium]